MYVLCECVCVCVCVCARACAQWFSRVQVLAIPWMVSHQAPLSVGFPRQEYWSGLPRPSPGDLPDPGIESMCLVSPALAGRFFTLVPPGKPLSMFYVYLYIKWSLKGKMKILLGNGRQGEAHPLSAIVWEAAAGPWVRCPWQGDLIAGMAVAFAESAEVVLTVPGRHSSETELYDPQRGCPRRRARKVWAGCLVSARPGGRPGEGK